MSVCICIFSRTLFKVSFLFSNRIPKTFSVEWDENFAIHTKQKMTKISIQPANGKVSVTYHSRIDRLPMKLFDDSSVLWIECKSSGSDVSENRFHSKLQYNCIVCLLARRNFGWPFEWAHFHGDRFNYRYHEDVHWTKFQNRNEASHGPR